MLILDQVQISLVSVSKIWIFLAHPFLRCQTYVSKFSESKIKENYLSQWKKKSSLYSF